MAGIYLHIPFCKRKCHYCNFYSSTILTYKPEFLKGLFREIELQKDYLGGESVQTIYLGGGTPSLLSPEDLEKLFEKLYQALPIENNAEITLEANPDDLAEDYLHLLHRLPINRLSIGIQSFDDMDLRYLNRIHSAVQALNCIEQAKYAGFENLNIDLIYGIPTLSDPTWMQNLEKAFSLHIPHISAYALTVEPQTALERMIHKGRVHPVNEEQMVRHFHIVCDQMGKNGYAHYEISNFCTGNQFSRHNVSYWSGEKYLGLGPSAHSYNGHSRQWNLPDLKTYIQVPGQNKIPFEIEHLTPDQFYNEYVMTSLRTMWGCDARVVKDRFGSDHYNHLMHQAAEWLTSGHLTAEEKVLRLTRQGQLFADRIAADLFVVD